MARHSRYIKTWIIALAIILIGICSATWRQLHNGWVWYHLLQAEATPQDITITSNYLLPAEVSQVAAQISILPTEQIATLEHQDIKQIALAQAGGQTRQILMQTTLGASTAFNEELISQGYHTRRFGGVIYGHVDPIKPASLIKRIALNIGKNYLNKKPLAVLEVPPGQAFGDRPAIVILQPYQAGIKTYIGLNKENISHKDQEKIQDMAINMDEARSMVILQPEHINLIPTRVRSYIEQSLREQLGFNHTAPNLLQDFVGPTAIVVGDRQQLSVAVSSPDEHQEISEKFLGYLNHEEAYGHPVTQTFQLPNGRRGQEVVPNLAQEYFASRPDQCQDIQGSQLQLVMCQQQDVVALGTESIIVDSAQELLRRSSQSENSWTLILQQDMLSRLPLAGQWQRLSGSQKGDDIAIILEK